MAITNQHVFWSGKYIFPDSADVGTLPDSAPLEGTISFVPTWDERVNGFLTDSSVSTHVASFTFSLRDGKLMSRDGSEWVDGIQLPAQIDDIVLSWTVKFRITAASVQLSVRDLGFVSVPDGSISLSELIPKDAISPKFSPDVVRGDSVENVLLEDNQLVFVIGSEDRATEKVVPIPLPSTDDLDSRYIKAPDSPSNGQIPAWDAGAGDWAAIDPPSGDTDAALINGVFTDRVDVSQARVTNDAMDRSVSELADEVDTKADQYHGHPMSSVDGLSDALDGKADTSHTHTFGDLQSVPDRFPAEQHTHPKGEVDGLDTALAGKADLDGAGRLPASQLPALAIVEFLGEVDGEAAMLTLSGERGDWCVRQDTGTQWVMIAEPSNVAGSWREMVAPPSPVQSVAGRIGAVVLSKADVGLSSVDNTSDADKPVSTATGAALALKSNTTHTHTAAQVGAIASDGTITKVIRITQAAYDALPARDPATLYVIGDA